jgi:hypothetical protein
MHESIDIPNAALVLETNNLRGGRADGERVAASLSRLLAHLSEQSFPISALAEVVITHDGLPDALIERIQEGCDARLRFDRVPEGTGYYAAKNVGFDATTAEVVVFGDSDCWPDRRWLEALLRPFASPETRVVSGRTTYHDSVFGQAASAIDFLYFETDAPGRTRNFYANNVAFRRDVFERQRFQPLPGTYRGHCQVLGMRLYRSNVPIVFVPEARTVHRFPDSAGELGKLRLLRGSDTVSVTPHLVDTYAPRAAKKALRGARLAPFAVLATRLACSLGAIGRQDMRRLGPLESVACAATVVGITALDAVGALRRARIEHTAGDVALSYHGAAGP